MEKHQPVYIKAAEDVIKGSPGNVNNYACLCIERYGEYKFRELFEQFFKPTENERKAYKINASNAWGYSSSLTVEQNQSFRCLMLLLMNEIFQRK